MSNILEYWSIPLFLITLVNITMLLNRYIYLENVYNSSSESEDNIYSSDEYSGNSDDDSLNDGHEDFEGTEDSKRKRRPDFKYNTLLDYYQDIAYHLYIEQQSECEELDEHYVYWNGSADDQIKIYIPNIDKLKCFIPPKVKHMDKCPLLKNQSMFLSYNSNGDDRLAYCYIGKINEIREFDRLEGMHVTLCFHKCLSKPNQFPRGTTFKILPASVNITRILRAMSNLKDKTFIKMLLGRKLNNLNISFKPYKIYSNSLNESQTNAINNSLRNKISIIKGPPGTGKTSVIDKMVNTILSNKVVKGPILVVASSNIAVDNIVLRLMESMADRSKILRIVSTIKENEYNPQSPIYSTCLHAKVLKDLPPHHRDTYLNPRIATKVEHNKLWQVQYPLIQKHVKNAKVILTTPITSGGFQLRGLKGIPIVIMDEATQTSEASCLIPLSLQGVGRFVFVGDEKQLNAFSNVRFLQNSLFERILKNGTFKNPHLLNIQYRMHPVISRFPIKQFYDNQLEDGVTEKDKKIENLDPLIFYNYKYQNRNKEKKLSDNVQHSGDYTYINFTEKAAVLRLLHILVIQKRIPLERIGVITPYSAQRDFIASSVQKDEKLNPEGLRINEDFDEEFIGDKKPTTLKTINGLMVSSVDSFQGREKDIIIFSCVRSNREKDLGFVTDRRRLNVALTRAKSSLIIIGNSQCLSKSKTWEKLINHIEKHGKKKSLSELK